MYAKEVVSLMVHSIFGHNFCKCRSIFKVSSLTESVADPGGIQGVRTPAVLIRAPFVEKNTCSKLVVNVVTVSINVSVNA